jgi:hypothetical protein
VALSALVLTPSPAAPAPASPHGLIGYEPQRSGVLGDEQPAHFTIEVIPRIPSRSNRSPEPRILAKRIACPHSPLPAFVGPLLPLCACSDIVRPCHGLRTLVQVVPWPTLDVRLSPPARLRPSPSPSARSSSRYAPRIPPASLLGISGRSAADTLPRSPATHRHRCRINRSPAPSPLQLGVVRQQPDRPRSSPPSPARSPHLHGPELLTPRHRAQPVKLDPRGHNALRDGAQA